MYFNIKSPKKIKLFKSYAGTQLRKGRKYHCPRKTEKAHCG